MYQIDAYVVYGNVGVCKVLDIGTLDMGGVDNKKLYYTLEPLHSNGNTIYTPVESKKVVIRDLITKDAALEMIDEIPQIETLDTESSKSNEEKYKKALKKYEFKEFIRIIKTLHLKEKERSLEGKTMTNTDKKYMDAAKDCLYSELSVTLEIPIEKVEDFISKRLELIQS